MKEKRVVVLGGTSGIGLATARLVASQGGETVIASSAPHRVEDALRQLPTGTRGHVLDLTDESAIRAFFEHVGAFDHLVYTAGEPLVLEELTSIDLATAREFLNLRFWGALAAVKYAAASIREGGSIVLSSGIASDRPGKGWAITASICGAMQALTRALAVELAPIRVNAVSPGLVRTPLWDAMPEAARIAMYENAAKSLPVRRLGEPEDIAQAYVFLMNERYCSGQTIVVDGGHVLV